MECIRWKGRMKRGTAPFSLDRNEYHVSRDAVPAWVCTQCGEPFFEAWEVELIQNASEQFRKIATDMSGERVSPQET